MKAMTNQWVRGYRLGAIPLLLFFSACSQWTASFIDVRSNAETMVMGAYSATPELNQRAVQDPSQKICSLMPDESLTQDQMTFVTDAAKHSVSYPNSGHLTGDWKKGAELVADGTGQRIVNGQIEKLARNGALCNNCHQIDPKEVNAGNLGPSLVGYAKLRGRSETVIRYTYEKIYNAWAFLPCSNMPRLGANHFLTPEQIADVVAYLTDPQSPVNAP